jgi:hypothetical protein
MRRVLGGLGACTMIIYHLVVRHRGWYEKGATPEHQNPAHHHPKRLSFKVV